jgi:transcriptional regulator EpsA
MLDTLRLEALIANIDASLKVYSRPHFFMWSQGLLQNMISHDVLICALRHGDPLSFRVDGFSTLAPDAGGFGDLFQRDAAAAQNLVKAWKQRRFRPVVCGTAADSPIHGGAFARGLERVGATRIVAHGVHDWAGDTAGLYVFASASAAVPDDGHLAQFVVPFLHAAWMRAQLQPVEEGGKPPGTSARILTVREQEILRWIYRGKSNFEVGAILKISPLTVKNHVQKILRKLNVVNRTQAVGKALDTRILIP